MSVAVTVVTGLIDTRFVDLMRDPVTTTSSKPADGASLDVVVATCACAAGMAADAAASASAARTASCNLRLFPISCSLTFKRSVRGNPIGSRTVRATYPKATNQAYTPITTRKSTVAKTPQQHKSV